MIPDFSIDGEIIVITGAAGILCGRMAQVLAELGAKIAVCDINEEKGGAVVNSIRQNGGNAEFFMTNVLQKQNLIEVRNKIISRFGKIDALINGAGGNKKDATVSPEMSFFELPVEALQNVFDLNIIGTLLASQVFGEYMAEQGDGTIINLSSMASITPLTNVVGYSAAKAAVNNFTGWLAVYMNQNYSARIRVNAIAPGFLLTEQNRFLLTNEDGTSTRRSEKIIAGTPMARYGEPDELMGTLVWLLSGAASFVTGVVVPVDGGFAAYSGV